MDLADDGIRFDLPGRDNEYCLFPGDPCFDVHRDDGQVIEIEDAVENGALFMRILLALAIVVAVSLPAVAQVCPAGTIRYDGICIPSAPVGAASASPGVQTAYPPVASVPLPNQSLTVSPMRQFAPQEGTYFHGFLGAKLGDAKPLTPVRAYLSGPEIPPARIGAYGLVVLRALPTPASAARLTMMCNSFVSTLAKQEDLPQSTTPEQQMLTIWPLHHPQALKALGDDCDTVLKDYDVNAGDTAVQDASRQGASFSGRGPYLIGWSPSNSRGVKDKLVLIIDMSGADNQASFDHYFLFWKEKVIEDPALWQHGFTIEKLKDALRDFADTHGQQMLDAIKLVGIK